MDEKYILSLIRSKHEWTLFEFAKALLEKKEQLDGEMRRETTPQN